MGIFFILLSIFLASMEPIIVKIGYGTIKADPLSIILFKNLVAGVVIIPLTTLLGSKFKVLSFRDILKICRVSLLLLFTTSMIIISLKYIPAYVMLTIFTSTPAFVTIINSLKGKERVDFIFWIGFIMAFLGITLLLDLYSKFNNGGIVWSSEFGFGILLAFLGVLSSSLYRTTLDDLTRIYSPILVSTYIFLINSLFVFLCSFILYMFYPLELSKEGMFIGLYGGIVGSMANISFLYALNLLGSTKVSILNMLQQPTIIILSVILLKEKLVFSQIIGIILVILGINISLKKIKNLYFKNS